MKLVDRMKQLGLTDKDLHHFSIGKVNGYNYNSATYFIDMCINAVSEAENLEDIPEHFTYEIRKFNMVLNELDEIIESIGISKDLGDIPQTHHYESTKPLDGFVSTEPYWTKTHSDAPRKYNDVRRNGRITEMIEWTEPHARENMIPDRIELIEMGTESRQTPWLDSDYDAYGRPCNTMNDRIFREMCVVYGNQLYAVYKKTDIDLNTGTKPEWVQEQIGCAVEDALTLVECWKRLGFDFKTSRRLVTGYWDEQSGKWRNGLGGTGVLGGRKYAKYFESLVWEVDAQIDDTRAHYHDVAEKMIESGDWRLKYGEDMPDAWGMMKFIEESSLVELDTELEIIEDERIDDMDGFVSHLGDEEYLVRGEDGFGVFPLWNGDEDIPYEFGVEIGCASIQEIGMIQKRFFPTRNFYSGKQIRAKYWYFTDQQKMKAWGRINQRKKELLEEAMKELSRDSKEVLAIACTLGNVRQSRALISAYCAGNGFNICGEVYKWEHKPSVEEKFAVWGQFRKEN